MIRICYNDEIEMNLNTCTKGDAEKFFNWDHNPTPNTFCLSEVLDDPYPCCSDPDAVVVTTDENGKWGIENDRWCGILESENTVAPPTNIETYLLVQCIQQHVCILLWYFRISNYIKYM